MKKKKKNEIENVKVEVKEEIVEKKEKQPFNTTSLILGLVGIILLFLPEESNKIIGILIGAALLLAGIITIIKYFKAEIKVSSLNLVSGILYAILGIIIVIYPLSIMKLATIILGVYLIVNGALKLHAGYISKDTESSKWKGLFIAGAIIVVFGLILIINPFSGLFITKVAGAFLVIVALYDILSQYIFNK